MTKLPDGWATATIDELAVRDGVTDGPFGSNLKTAHYTSEGPRVVRLQNIGDGQFRDEYAHISLEHFQQLRKHEVEPADVLVASLGEQLPRACLAPTNLGPAIVKADCIRIRTGVAVSSDYLMWSLNAPQTRDRVAESIKGVGRPRINLGDLRSLELPVAPLAEQERIVTAIEEAFSKLDPGESGLRTVSQLLKRMQEAVLTAAVTGRLLPQDPTDTPAARLLADLGVAERLPTDGSPPGWSRASIADLVGPTGLFVDGDWVESKDQDPAGDVRLTQLADIGVGVWRNRSDRYMTASAAARLNCTSLEVGDVLVARMPDPLGRACQFPGDTRRCVTAVDVAIIRPGKGGVDAKWLMWAINSPSVRAVIESHQAGTTRKRISRKNLAVVELLVPPIAEQGRIVAEIERQFSFIEACERAVDAGLARSAALRRSILKAAFEGRLVLQDPSDEPASVLLERIRTERSASGWSGGGRRRRRVEAS